MLFQPADDAFRGRANPGSRLGFHGASRRQDNVVFREVRIKADADAEAGRIEIRQSLIDRRLGKAEGLDRADGHMLRRFREFPPQNREDPFGQHPFHFPGHARNDRNHLALLLQREAGRRSHRIGDHFRPFGKVRLLGIVFRPVKAVFFKDPPNVPENGLIPVKLQSEGPGNRRGGDIVGRGTQTARDDNGITLGQDITQGLFDETVVIADGHHQAHRPSLGAENTGHQGRIRVLGAAAGQLIANGENTYFHGNASAADFLICPRTSPESGEADSRRFPPQRRPGQSRSLPEAGFETSGRERA